METLYFEEEFYGLLAAGQGRVPTQAVVVEVFKQHTDKLYQYFISYTTNYRDKQTGDIKGYNLKLGWKLVIILSTGGRLFTAIRDWSTTNEERYRALRGEVVNIKIVEESK